ncbi:hypothetical protein ACFQV4_26970 [Streptomyces thermocarboxydus]
MNALLGMEEDYAGWNRWAYLLFFAYGFLLADDEQVRVPTRRAAVRVGVLGVALFAGTAPGFVAGDDPFTAWTPAALATQALFGAAGWCWVLAILGLLDRRPASDGGCRRSWRTWPWPPSPCTSCTSRWWSPARTGPSAGPGPRG